MIPLELTFEAFGPFPGRQSIDFTAFESERIFLISGMTGSGKTTIFDAICFCLYGTASGGLRETESFKSDFADEKAVCFAEFSFLVHGRRYTVRREPIQTRLKRGGNRVKDSNSTAVLTYEDGTSLTGPLNVTARVEELLGITADQFKKIVMLPQGEFRRFLSDDSAKKQETLRKIFSTEVLDAFTERLRLNASALRLELEQELTRSRAHVEGILCEEDSALWCALHADEPDIPHILRLLKEENRRLRAETARTRRELGELDKRKAAINIPYAQEINRKFSQLTESREALAALTAQQPHYAELEKRIALLKSIREVGVYEAAANQAQAEALELEGRLAEERASLTRLRAELAEAEHSLQEARGEQEKLPALVREAEQWKAKAASLREAEEARKKLGSLEQEAERLSRENALLQRQLLHAGLLERREEWQKRQEDQARVRSEILRCGELSRKFREASDAYQAAMNAFLDSQSYLLAGELREGEPCPVCGSRTHPVPAPEPASIVTKEELERFKERYEEASRQLKEQQGLCRQLLLGTGYDVKAHGRLSEFLPEIEAACGEAAEQLAACGRDLAPYLTETTPVRAEAEARLASCATAAAVNAERRSALAETLAALREKLGGASLTLDQVQETVLTLQNRIRQIDGMAELAASRREELYGSCQRTEEAIRQLAERGASLTETARKNGAQARLLLEKLGVSGEEYRSCQADAGRLPELEEALAGYREASARRRSVIDSLAPQLEGLSPVDVEALERELAAVQAEIDSASQRYTAGSGRLQSNRERYVQLRGSWREAEALTASQGRAQKLYDVANGKYSDKVNFERYVLAGYFSDVIDNANLRLAKMTGSRYTLNRRTEREKGNKSSGLSLEVFDAYTGKARHVNTLSGGESFKIALALALGLADIISQNSGGIELGTMFIDEGFGSLDQNSLESAIECLSDLRSSGRYIGIISHVSELKEKIPAKINVIQEPQGSSIQVQA